MTTFYAGQPDYIDKLNTLASVGDLVNITSSVDSASAAAEASASAAEASAASALVSANNSAASTGAAKWVSGTTYAVGVVTWSPDTSRTYRRIVAGAGTTDPSLDTTNWSMLTLEIDTGYPTTRPTLNLDFANSQSVDSRITFTRASTATRTNSRGLLEVVPSGVPRIDYAPVTGECKGLLIEEARTNLLTYSERFYNAAWGKQAVTVTAGATAAFTAPDGTFSADKLVESTANAEHMVGSGLTVTSGVTYAFSIFAKAAERTKVRLRTAVSFPDLATVFDLSLGMASSSTHGAGNSGVTPMGNGWYRCWVIGTANATGNGVARVQLVTDAGAVSYVGDGTSGIYIWGAQLEVGAFPTTYIPSTETWTGRASIGTYYNSIGQLATALSGVSRLSYNPANLTVAPKLLLEAAGTNLLTYSEQFDNVAWGKNNITVTPNATTAPDGTLTADKLNETAVTSFFAVNNNPAGSFLTTYTFSCYAKAAERNFLNVNFTVAGVMGAFNLTTGETRVNSGALTLSTASVGGGWYRCVATFTTPASGSNILYHVFGPASTNTGVTYAGVAGSGIFIWGAQLEAGSFPTSYIPTTTAAVTRAADVSSSAATTRAADVAVMTGNNFSSWYRQDESTIVVGWNAAPNTSDSNHLALIARTATPEAVSMRIGYSGVRRARYYGQDILGVFQYAVDGDVLGASTSGTLALAFKPSNDFYTSTNGAAVGGDAIGAIAPNTHDRLVIGSNGISYANACIKSLRYYPKRLTNAELQALSTN